MAPVAIAAWVAFLSPWEATLHADPPAVAPALVAPLDDAAACTRSTTTAVSQSIALIDSIEVARPQPLPRAWTARACAAAFAALATEAPRDDRTTIGALHDHMEALATAVDALNEALAQGASTQANAEAIVVEAARVSEAIKQLVAARTAATAARKRQAAGELARRMLALKQAGKARTVAYHLASLALARLRLDAAIEARDGVELAKQLKAIAAGRDRLARMAGGNAARAAYLTALRELHAAAAALAPLCPRPPSRPTRPRRELSRR